MPNAQCPIPHVRRVPHVTDKGYISFSMSLGGSCKLFIFCHDRVLHIIAA